MGRAGTPGCVGSSPQLRTPASKAALSTALVVMMVIVSVGHAFALFSYAVATHPMHWHPKAETDANTGRPEAGLPVKIARVEEPSADISRPPARNLQKRQSLEPGSGVTDPKGVSGGMN